MEFDIDELIPIFVGINLLINLIIMILVILIYRQRTGDSSLPAESANPIGNGGVIICKNCMQSYPATLKKCPHYGTKR